LYIKYVFKDQSPLSTMAGIAEEIFMNKTLLYLFDPLCGWCYGATPSLSVLIETHGVSVELLPTGLFSGEGARPMDSDFAAYAWSNDQRIARLTGQSFTESYRELVIGNRQQFLDSGPATVALTAVSLTSPGKELDVLKSIQRARYVDGLDVTALQTLTTTLKTCGLEEAATLLQSRSSELLGENRRRIDRAKTLMRELGANGVPAFIVKSGSKKSMLNVSAAYSNPKALISQLQAA
jgi:putative protein-disulfide isomerase